MKITVAIDSFKGSLSSLRAGEAVKEAALELSKENEVFVRPVADGGEGTVEALSLGMGGTLVTVRVAGPLFAPVDATYAILPDGKTAVIEMAAAAGITLLPKEKLNPLLTTTYGVGEMIKDAIKRGCRRFIVGIGGSATNDGGVGMLTALGYEFLDEDGVTIPLSGKGLDFLVSICDERVLPALAECSFRVACDVKNPLCGENGCSAVYGPQKGATPEAVKFMDRGMALYARIAATVSDRADPDYPGVGAAGGLGFAFRTFLGATLSSGIGIVLEETRLEDYIKESDLVITGEGRLDAQTAMGKAPAGVAAIAKKHGKPVIAFSGCATREAELCNECGIDAFFPIPQGACTLDEAMDEENAFFNLKATAKQALRLFSLCKNNLQLQL
jgi:glycerate kinase